MFPMVLVDDAPFAHPTRRWSRHDLVRAAVVVVGSAVAAILVLDGSAPWRVVRPLFVVCATVATLAAVRSGPSRRAALIALAIGVAGTPAGVVFGLGHVSNAGLTATAAAGVLLLAGSIVLLAHGTVSLVRSVPGWRRVLAVPAALVVIAFVGYPVFAAVYATNVPRPHLGSATPADRGLSYEDAEFVTTDGVWLSGWYVPSSNGAALVLLHGASSTRSNVLDHAELLARHGYGVLLFDARGHGRSDGRAMDFGWYGDLDTSAAVSFLVEQPGVDPSRIAAVGFSMGGEQAIGAAAYDPRLAAVVAEGATNRTAEDKDGWLPDGPTGWLQRRIDWVTYSLADLLTDARPPIPLHDAVGAASRPMLLIAGNGEEDAARYFAAGSPSTVEVWAVDAGHTDALATYPAEWEQRVVGFLATALGLDPD